jgi:DNA ligase (NAD+)
VMARDLSENFINLDELAKAKVDDLMQIGGLGPNIAASVVDWFSLPFNRQVLKKLKSAGVWPQGGQSAISNQSDKFADLTFVITGTLPTFSRDDAKAFIESHSGKVTDSISKKTSYLVVGENAGSKLDKAQSLGVKIISETELRKLAG